MSGVSSLSDEQLLVIALNTSSGDNSVIEQTQILLENFTLQELLKADFGQLSIEYNLGNIKASQLQAILEIARRLTIPSIKEKYYIRSVEDAVILLRPDMAFLDHEEMRVLVLDTKSAVVYNQRLYQGTVSSTVASSAEIFQLAVTRKYPKIILCHNHPSGSPEPSPEDMEITRECIEAGRVLDIELLDHIIIGGHRHISLKERMRW